jgi:hypothetical protein
MKNIQFFAHPKATESSMGTLMKKASFPNPSGRSEMKMKDDFDKSFRETVDEVLKQIFGQSAALIIYSHLEKNNSLTQEEIPEKLENFVRGLENFLSSGALVIEGIILKQLYSSYGLEFKGMEEGYSFIDYITKLKQMTDEKARKRKGKVKQT